MKVLFIVLCVLVRFLMCEIHLPDTPGDDWTCNVTLYNNGGDCNCECGVPDPDCNPDLGLPIVGCDDSLNLTGCNLQSHCMYDTYDYGEDDFFSTPPSEWFCNVTLWNADDGICHCECGAPDPDCKDGSVLYNCGENDAFCNHEGHCDGWKASGVPVEWHCGNATFGTYDGCDCGCGARDPDCDFPMTMQPLKNCPEGDGKYFCNFDNVCQKEVMDTGMIPPEWYCYEGSFGSFDGCHCECGAFDPDCHDPMQELFGCGPDATYCDFNGHCQYGNKEDDGFHDFMWYCPMEQFGSKDGCHCNCGGFDMDCMYSDQVVIGCEDDAAKPYCDWNGQCTETALDIHPPPEWTCDSSKFADGSICDCNCGTGDPDCFYNTSVIVGCANETDRCDNKDGLCYDPQKKFYDSIPPEWWCEKETYGEGEACNCNCGAYDPDCDDHSLEVKNCESDQYCGFDGWCKSGDHIVPNDWWCEPQKYGNYDGCHCNCGVYDPDCDDMYQPILGCSPDEFCNHDGMCEVETNKQIPPSWYCSLESFGGMDGCDCNCGGYDPDCNNPGAYIKNCGNDVVACGMYGECIYEDNKYDDVPSSWWCPQDFFDRDDYCDCNCGAYDPDCDKPGSILVGCPPEAGYCTGGGVCGYGVPPNWECDPAKYNDGLACDCGCGAFDLDCELFKELPVHGCGDREGMVCGEKASCIEKPPENWFCPMDMYNNGGACDCSCGAYDPDCDDSNAQLFGCSMDATGCTNLGNCEYPAGSDRNVPVEWKCMESSFHGMDGCHCECGAYDPDCDDSNMMLFGCGPNAYGCDGEGHCLVYDMGDYNDVPDGWWCDPNSFDAYDGCHCECGAYDPDCDMSWQTLLGCGGDAVGCDWEGHCMYDTNNHGGDEHWAPEEWTCEPEWWGNADGCHCNCGVYDPDCDWGYDIFGCDDGFAIGCDLFGSCIYGVEGQNEVPNSWWCNPEAYGNDQYCDCNCGAFDPDCMKPGAILMNCPLGATQCDMGGWCAYGIPMSYLCPADTFDTSDGCHCGCGAYDPDCAKEGQAIIGCNPGELCDETGKCVAKDVPDDWTCPISWYGSDGACDCDCGAFDPDCVAKQDGTVGELNGCQPDAIGCDYDGKCKYPDGFNNQVPSEWTCWESHFGTEDGCHCNCGVYDPDCDEQMNQLYFCPGNAIGCNSDGTCMFETRDDDGTNPDDEEEYTEIPEEWKCRLSYYAADDGCHCECGAFDPDCVDPDAMILGCGYGATACSKQGTCIYSDGGGGNVDSDEDSNITVPNDWTCQEEYYGAGDGCDCNCGAYDPDCENEENEIFGCSRDATGCSQEGECVVPEDTGEKPDGWTCSSAFYEDGETCDCGCGIFDPDCSDERNTLSGCGKDAIGCDPDGECIDNDIDVGAKNGLLLIVMIVVVLILV